MLAPIALACVWLGGLAFTLLIGAALVLLVGEWARLCLQARAPWLLAGGTGWIVLAAAALLWLRADPTAGRANLLFVLLVVWASDIGAYLAGRLLGGPRLAPLISPGKTWSGAAGGLAAALGVGWAAAWSLPAAGPPGGGPAWVAAVALGLCVIGQLGDLAESWAKRRFGVKELRHADPRPWRPAGPAGRAARRGAVRRAAGALPRTWSSVVAMSHHPARSVTVLGSTGSVGTQTVELLRTRTAPVPGARAGRRAQRRLAGRSRPSRSTPSAR